MYVFESLHFREQPKYDGTALKGEDIVARLSRGVENGLEQPPLDCRQRLGARLHQISANLLSQRGKKAIALIGASARSYDGNAIPPRSLRPRPTQAAAAAKIGLNIAHAFWLGFPLTLVTPAPNLPHFLLVTASGSQRARDSFWLGFVDSRWLDGRSRRRPCSMRPEFFA